MQLSAVKIEADHERLQLETRLAETGARARSLREDSNSLVRWFTPPIGWEGNGMEESEIRKSSLPIYASEFSL